MILKSIPKLNYLLAKLNYLVDLFGALHFMNAPYLALVVFIGSQERTFAIMYISLNEMSQQLVAKIYGLA
jgi:hypothetical protein